MNNEIQKLNGGQIRDDQQRLKQDLISLGVGREAGEEEGNPCGKDHNNGDDDCLECSIIKRNI